jgi:UDP-N-acetylmuramoylalanine--D-glutamate ligase
MEALKSFWKRVDTILLWGTNRGYDFRKLMEMVQEYEIQNIVFFPPSGEIMSKYLNNFKWKILYTDRMEDAVAFAFVNTEKWKICLLSTASPSYSVWKNFEEKWNLFKEAIKKFEEETPKIENNLPPVEEVLW